MAQALVPPPQAQPALRIRRSVVARWLTPTAIVAGPDITKFLTQTPIGNPKARFKTIRLVNGLLMAFPHIWRS